MKIAVLFGGCSSEYGVSLQSAYAVMEELKKLEYEVLPIGIMASGICIPETGNGYRRMRGRERRAFRHISVRAGIHMAFSFCRKTAAYRQKPSMWYFRYCMAKTEKMVRYRAYVNWQGFRLLAAVR